MHLKRTCVGIALIAAAIFLIFTATAKAQVISPSRGGTGTSTMPSIGQVLVGQSNGTYAPQATSSLGFSFPDLSSYFTLASWYATSTDALAEGSANLFYTTGRAQSALAAGYNAIFGSSTTTSATSTNLAVTGSFNLLGTVISNVSTWFNGLFDTAFSGKTTSDLSEGSNLYFTSARADARINATSTIGTLTSAPNLSTLSTSLSGILKASSGAVSAAASGTDYQPPVSLTTTGTSGAATFDGTTLNIPQYAGTTYTASYPVTLSGSAFGIAFGTTTSNTWAGTQTFDNTIKVGALSGLIGANSGTLYGIASSSLFGFTPVNPTRSISTTYPLQGGGDLSSDRTISLAFGTTTDNTWGGTQTFANTPKLSTLSGVIYGDSGTLSAGATTTASCSGTVSCATFDILGSSPITIMGSGSTNALSTTSPWTPGQLPAVASNSAVYSVATSSASLSSSFSYSGSLGSLVGGTSGTLSIANGGVTNIMLANSSLSFGGVSVALGGADATPAFDLTDATNLPLVEGTSGTLPISRGGTGTTTAPASQLLYGGSSGSYQSVATSSASCTSASGISCSSFTIVGTGGAILSLSGIPNSSLANSTISGVALGSNLANLSATNSTLTFSGSYNGSAARTVGLNLANANSWTGLQQFNANATTTQLTVTGSSYLATSGGNVGIGTTSPGSKLSVQGNIFLAGNLVSTSTATSSFAGGVQAAKGYFSGLVEFASNVIAKAGSVIDLSAATVRIHTYPKWTWPGVATTTSATTTVPLGQAMSAEGWNYSTCRVTSASGGYRYTDGTNAMNYIPASTTASRYTLTSNTTFVLSENQAVEVGPLTNAQITCGVDITVNQ